MHAVHFNHRPQTLLSHTLQHHSAFRMEGNAAMLRHCAPETQLYATASQRLCAHSAAPLKKYAQPTISISAVAGAASAAAPATAAKPLPDLKSIKGVLFDIDGETLSCQVTPYALLVSPCQEA